MAKTEDILAGYYRDASKRMRRMLLGPVGKTQRARAFRRGRSATLLKQVDRLWAETTGKAVAVLDKRLSAAFVRGQKDCEKFMRDQGFKDKVSAPPFALVGKEQLRVLAEATKNLTAAGDAMRKGGTTFLRGIRAPGVSESRVNEIIASAAITGSRDGLRRELTVYLRDEAKVGDHLSEQMAESARMMDSEIIPVGKGFMQIGNYAKLVARSRMAEVQTKGTLARMDRRGIDLVEVVGGAGYEDFCLDFEGAILSVSGRDPDYPALSELPGGGPPFHPNCAHRLAPVVKELWSAKNLNAGKGTAILNTSSYRRAATPAAAQKRWIRRHQRAA